MQPPTLQQKLELQIAAAKREGRGADAKKLETQLKQLPPSPAPTLASPAQRRAAPKVEKRFGGFGPPEKADEDKRLMND